ncbi:lysophospholipase [Thioflavicoccus mobilis 8321]|uniref:Lysophospholipase n=1 Tax=Thioflavicoccus mobilis 8321 TaxID=765912 RepID=L0H203_9GAMM|nr:alpha/beta hydrolase [Thioflavicoccus mobilis]AGA91614.1 lysophospholipase [Thioflavicoccus mobilis 8321]
MSHLRVYSPVFILIALVAFAGCAPPRTVAEPHATVAPHLAAEAAWMPDGYRLPLQVWPAVDGAPAAVLLGLHGFNDYSHAFAPLAQDLAEQGITTYAVDQRGFGATDKAGRWPGSGALVADLQTMVRLLRARYPDTPLFVAGESMGGAVAMIASARTQLAIDGLVLIAPAVWSRDTMPWYQRLALAMAVRTLPWLELTGKGIRLRPSDNHEMLRAMGADPLVIKATRVDALWGVTNLMDEARAAAPNLSLPPPILVLYGEHDEIIPPNAFCNLLPELPEDPALRLALYHSGWHMLPRDRRGARVRTDIAAWLADPASPLPSAAEVRLGDQRLAAFCDEH